MADERPTVPTPAEVADAVVQDAGLDLQPPVQAARVGGGYSWRTYVVTDATGRRVVARVAPPGGTMSPYDPELEARAVRAAQRSVPTPDVLAVVPLPNRLGAAYGVHGFAEGDVRRMSRIPVGEQPRYRTAFATTLGRLHAGAAPAAFDATAATGSTTDAMRGDLDATVSAFARGAPCRHPGFTIGIRWLLTHLPQVPAPPRLCHGDFRFHNLAWADGEVAAVLDWERAWVGDPMVDIAFTRRFSGWCAVDGDAVSAYEAASGIVVDEARVAYGDRYEWVRAYTSSVRGWRALADGRDDALPLYAIGEAGWAGAWSLVDLLADGPLVPAPADGLDPHPHPAFPPGRRDQIAAVAVAEGQADLAAHLAADEGADARATVASLDALRGLADIAADGGVAELRQALAHPDDKVAWARAHVVLAEAAITGGPELIAPLHALGRRHTDRTTMLPSAPQPRNEP